MDDMLVILMFLSWMATIYVWRSIEDNKMLMSLVQTTGKIAESILPAIIKSEYERTRPINVNAQGL